jgi:hypothetical protein
MTSKEVVLVQCLRAVCVFVAKLQVGLHTVIKQSDFRVRAVRLLGTEIRLA